MARKKYDHALAWQDRQEKAMNRKWEKLDSELEMKKYKLEVKEIRQPWYCDICDSNDCEHADLIKQFLFGYYKWENNNENRK